MIITKPRILIAIMVAGCLYWIPAVPFPDQTRAAVNACFFILSLMTSGVLFPDIVDIVRHNGAGLSWQALFAKAGLFVLTATFAAARIWALVAAAQNFPDWFIHSPVGGFLSYLMGIGLFGIFYGFSSAGDIHPQITSRGALVVTLVIGVVVGVVIGKLPV